MLLAKRDAIAAKVFFKKVLKKNGWSDKVTVDKSGGNKAAFGDFNRDVPKEEEIGIKQTMYLTNIAGQDQHFIKKHTWPTLGFKKFLFSQRNAFRD